MSFGLEARKSSRYRGWKPRSINILKKRAISMFETNGYSTHSAIANTLWILINHCEENRIGYILEAQPGLGYHIRKHDFQQVKEERRK